MHISTVSHHLTFLATLPLHHYSNPVLTIHQAEEILNKKSGWKVLTGTTDFSEIAVENPPSAGHKLAFDIVIDRMLGYIGSYFVKLEGQVDALVFSGGIGEKSALLRQTLVGKCKCLGFSIDEGLNERGPGEEETVLDISKDGSAKRLRVLIVQTNEQVSFFFVSVYVGE